MPTGRSGGLTVAHELVIQYILNILEAVASQTKTILVADEVWVALAMLHRNQPERASFYASEIVDQIRAEKAAGSFRPGIHPHIYLHCVANLAPNAARYRMLFKLDDDTYRLYRTGDYAHPERRGKTAPKRNDLPTRYHHLLDWYETNYCRREAIAADQDDPILQLWGLGKHIWADATADDYVASLRAGWNAPPAPAEPPSPAKPLPDEDAIWQRIADHQGETFYTKKRLPFTYRLE